jgi:hypothetical protein
VVDEPGGEQTGQTAKDAIANPLPEGQVKAPPALGAHEAPGAERANERRDGDQRPSRNFLRRLTVNEGLTLLVAIASLAVSILTLRVVADSSDIKSAIGNLSELAAQTKRQADATNGQLTEMRDEQRPWLQVIPKIDGPLTNKDGRLTVEVGLGIKNSGRTPAVAVKGRAELQSTKAIYPISDSVGIIKALCKSSPSLAWKFITEDGGYDIVFPENSDVVDVEAANIGVYDKKMPFFDEGFLGLKEITTPVHLVFCVAYKGMGEDDPHHTGGIISISFPEAMPSIKSGQSIPANSLSLKRFPFEWQNYAD